MIYEEVLKKKKILNRYLERKDKSSIKLPALKLPVFSWDLFSYSVHVRKDLMDIQKFTNLKGQLAGEPLRLISGFNLEGSNYQSAVQLLQEIYGQNDRIKADHISHRNHISTDCI